MVMVHYEAEIKEVGMKHTIKSSLYCSEKAIEELVDFWGLNNQDVEHYTIYEIRNGKRTKLKDKEQ